MRIVDVIYSLPDMLVIILLSVVFKETINLDGTVLQDIGGKNVDGLSFMRTRSPVLDAALNPLEQQIPTLGGDVLGAEILPEPKPYFGQ